MKINPPGYDYGVRSPQKHIRSGLSGPTSRMVVKMGLLGILLFFWGPMRLVLLGGAGNQLAFLRGIGLLWFWVEGLWLRAYGLEFKV